MRDPEVGAGTDGIRLGATLLTATGLVTASGAVAAYVTGAEVYVRGETVRTHTDAVWVLGVVAAALMVAAFVLVMRISALESGAVPARSDRA